MPEAKEFRVERSWVVLAKWLGFPFVGFGLLCVAGPFFDPTFPWWVAALGLVPLSMGLSSLRLGFQPERYSIELSDEGVRVPAESRWAPWSQLEDLSERSVLQRVDILDHAGRCFASLEYQLDGFSEALARTIAAIRLEPPPQDRFRGWLSHSDRVVVAVGGAILGIYSLVFGIVNRSLVGGLLLPGTFLCIGAVDALIRLRSVEIRREGLLVTRGLRARTFPWKEIVRVELSLGPAVRRHRALEVYVVGPSGTRTPIRPPGTNPFHVWKRAADRLEAERTGVRR
jgi:hypothetical protein